MTNFKSISILIYTCLISSMLLLSSGPMLAQQFPKIDPNAKITYKIIPVENNTWGYDIYNNGKLLLHQPRIPAIPGNEGFEKKTDAEKVAKKVIEKIRKGETPPSVSVKELEELKVLPGQ